MCANLPVMQSKTQVLQYLLIFRIANQIVIFHGVKVQVKQEFQRLALFTPPGWYQKSFQSGIVAIGHIVFVPCLVIVTDILISLCSDAARRLI